MGIKDLLVLSAKRTPDAVSIKGPDDSLTYVELYRLANRIAWALDDSGVRKGDRVGIWLDTLFFVSMIIFHLSIMYQLKIFRMCLNA
jgi:acyl-CoA synthetase (AMP-forming)/AMP-acid ligase II